MFQTAPGEPLFINYSEIIRYYLRRLKQTWKDANMLFPAEKMVVQLARSDFTH